MTQLDSDKLTELLPKHRDLLKPDTVHALLDRWNKGDANQKQHFEKLLARSHGPAETKDPHTLAFSAHCIGQSAADKNDNKLAVARFQDAAELFAQTKDLAWHAGSLFRAGRCQIFLNQVDESRKTFEQSLVLFRQIYKAPHTHIAGNLNNLSIVYRRQNDLDKALDCQRESLAMYRELHPDPHPDLVRAVSNLAIVLGQRKEYDEAARNIAWRNWTCGRQLAADRQGSCDDYL